MALLICFYRLY